MLPVWILYNSNAPFFCCCKFLFYSFLFLAKHQIINDFKNMNRISQFLSYIFLFIFMLYVEENKLKMEKKRNGNKIGWQKKFFCCFVINAIKIIKNISAFPDGSFIALKLILAIKIVLLWVKSLSLSYELWWCFSIA